MGLNESFCLSLPEFRTHLHKLERERMNVQVQVSGDGQGGQEKITMRKSYGFRTFRGARNRAISPTWRLT